MRLHSVSSTSNPNISSFLVNPKIDYVFLADEESVGLVLESSLPSEPGQEPLGAKIRHLALPLSIFEVLIKVEPTPGIRDLFRAFPDVEEVILVAGEPNEDALRQDVEFVMPRKENLPRKGMLMNVCMEIFHPWRAFDHLFGAELMEDAFGKWVTEKHAAKGEWKVPKFRIREAHCMSGSTK